MTRHLTIVIGLVLFGGCATMGDVLDAKSAGRGTERVYPVSADRAWDIARTVFRWEGAAAIEEHRVEGYMLTTLGQRTYAGAWVSPRGPEFSAVIVITKSHSPITELTEMRFHLDLWTPSNICVLDSRSRCGYPRPPKWIVFATGSR